VILQRATPTECGTDLDENTFRLLSIDPNEDEILQKNHSNSNGWQQYSTLCLSGQAELELDGQNFILNPGDRLDFNSDAFHRWRNSDRRTGIIVLVLTPSSSEDLTVEK
jgi:hypothetical protein